MKINKEIKDIILKRLFISRGILFIIRIGTFLPIPGINHTDLACVMTCLQFTNQDKTNQFIEC